MESNSTNIKAQKWAWFFFFALLFSLPAFADTAPSGSILQLRPIVDTHRGTAIPPDAVKMTLEVTNNRTGITYTQVHWVSKTVLIDQDDLQSASVNSSIASNSNFPRASEIDPILIRKGTKRFPGGPEIDITLTPKGSKRIAEFTRDNLGHPLAIIIDGHLVLAPVTQSRISGGKFIITENLTPRQAADLSDKINQAIKK